MAEMAICPLCGAEFDYPAALRVADRMMAEALGAEAGDHCDDCAEILVNGAPEQLAALLDERRDGK